jgi:hypothetical protein
MTSEERLRILGADCVAEIHQIVAAAPPPAPELIEELRQIFAPAVRQIAAEEAATANARTGHQSAA